MTKNNIATDAAPMIKAQAGATHSTGISSVPHRWRHFPPSFLAVPAFKFLPMTQPLPKPETIAEGKFIRLVRQGEWEYATRKGVSGIVGIVAVTDGRKLVLVEQDRAAVGKRVIELPAGLAGDQAGHETEALEEAARRELLEETGYEARRMERVAEGAVSAGMTDEIITLFLATDIKKTCDAKGDGSEDITVHEVPVDAVLKWLEKQAEAGKLIDLKVYSGLYFAGAPRP
jgi:ADP-ribose pyrophosphatase